MPKVFKILPILALLGVLPSFVSARSADMFGDPYTYTTVYNRPGVSGDESLGHSDMFGSPEIFVLSGTDMFGRVSIPPDYGVEDMFKAHLNWIPDEPLYHWPKGQPYP